MKDDFRILELDDRADAIHCIAQALTGNEQLLGVDDVDPKRRRLNKPPPEDWDRAKMVLEGAGFLDPRPLGTRESSITFTADNLGLPCPCCVLVHDHNNWWVSEEDDGRFKVCNYSKRCRSMLVGEANAMFQPDVGIETILPIRATVEQKLNASLTNMGFVTGPLLTDGVCLKLQQHLDTCPTCKNAHKLDTPYVIKALVEHCFTVGNVDPVCEGRIVHIPSMLEEHHILRRIIENPSTDTPLADLYVAESAHNLVEVDDVVYRFHNSRWTVVDDADLDQDIRAFLERVLHGLVQLLLNEEGKVQFHTTNEEIKKLQHLRKQIRTSIKFVEQVVRRRHVMMGVKNNIHDSKLRGKWDNAPNLLGMADGVVMLDTGVFRPATKEDYVTMSCGYPWLKTVDSDTKADLEDFIAKVYPLPEEREFMQRYCYYCLQGLHREKIFMVLNDARDGWNGKSTFLSLLMSTMGGYAIKADPCVLYKQDKTRGINDHSGGLLAFEKKRLMVVEETSAGALMDEEKLKEYHGSRARVSGRQLHSKQMHEFEWVTKLILAANEGKLPAWNVQDGALTSRIATMPHRSRFQHPPLPDEPYTYQADVHIKDKFEAWRPYMLMWCLGGRERYQLVGFKEIPPGCLAFKQTLMDEKDVVKEWLTYNVEKGNDKEYVKVIDLYQAFTAANRDLQRDKKTKKTAKMFEKELQRCLGLDTFKDKHQYKYEGKNITVGKVFLSFRRQDQ